MAENVGALPQKNAILGAKSANCTWRRDFTAIVVRVHDQVSGDERRGRARYVNTSGQPPKK